MTKRIFRSIFCVSALVLVAGLVLMLGVLYPYFNDQLEKELDRKAHYLPLWWKARAWTAYRGWL